MKVLKWVLIAFLITTYFGGCALKDKREAESLVNGVFESIRSKDFEKALTFYSAESFGETPREEWLDGLIGATKRLGELQSYELTDWAVTTEVATWRSGTYWDLQYLVTYSKYQAREKVTVFRPLLGGELKIVGHTIISPGFTKD